MRGVMIALTLGAALAAALPATHAAAAKKVRVLVVTGGHDFERAPFFAMLDRIATIEWREVQHPNANNCYAPGQRATYDVVLLYDMPQEISEQQKAWFLDTLREGKGFLVLHHALASYQNWPAYTEMVGGKFFLGPATMDGKEWPASTWRHDVPLTVRVADRRHPITRGLQDFALVDEVYGGFWVSPKVHALLKTDHPESGRIIGWTNQYGRARIVCLVGGHGPTAFENESFRTLVARSLEWVARRR